MPGIALLALLIAVLALLQYRRSVYSNKLSIIVVYAINLLGVWEYPYILGGLDITNYLNSSVLTWPQS